MVQKENNPYEMSSRSPAASLKDALVTFPQRALIGSLAVMLPWPMLGIVACLGWSLFEKSSEAILLFGSVTMILLLPLGLVVSSEWIFGTLIGIVWLLVLFMPRCFQKSSIHPRYHVELVFVLQSLFSAIQAGLGFLVILGKQC